MKKYILKPGRHQFVPGSHPIHHNNNLTDEEAEWYLAKYPHIASMFDTIPGKISPETDQACRVSDEEPPENPQTESVESPPESVESLIQSVESNLKSVKSQIIIYEDLPPAN